MVLFRRGADVRLSTLVSAIMSVFVSFIYYPDAPLPLFQERR